MATIPTLQAQPGQTLARSVTGASGTIIAGAGLQLTKAIIARLRTLGIDAIEIADESDASDAERLRLLEELDARFAGHEHDELMMALKATVATQLGGPSA
ncbi:MAG: hypothetical protein U0Q12_25835 [Vicinamibacterales bacterium]